MSLVGPKSMADVRQFLTEATGLPVLGCEFKRTPSGYLVMRCGYIDVRGVHHTKRLAMGTRFPNPMDEVVDLAVMMTEWMTTGEGHMLGLLDSTKAVGHG